MRPAVFQRIYILFGRIYDLILKHWSQMRLDRRWIERVSWAVRKVSSRDNWIRWNCWVKSRYSFRCEIESERWRGTNTLAENFVKCSPRIESSGMTIQLHQFIDWLLFWTECVQAALNFLRNSYHSKVARFQFTLSVMTQQMIFKDASISSFISSSGEQRRRERFLSRNFRLDQ